MSLLIQIQKAITHLRSKMVSTGNMQITTSSIIGQYIIDETSFFTNCVGDVNHLNDRAALFGVPINFNHFEHEIVVFDKTKLESNYRVIIKCVE